MVVVVVMVVVVMMMMMMMMVKKMEWLTDRCRKMTRTTAAIATATATPTVNTQQNESVSFLESSRLISPYCSVWDIAPTV